MRVLKKDKLEKIKKILQKKETILLILILVFGFFLRIYFLGHAPFWVDENISSIASKEILEKGIPKFDSGFMYLRAPVFHYSQALSFLIGGVDDFSARFPSVIFALLTIILAYYIGKEYSESGGLIAALFVSVFYLEVFFSRQARFYQLFQLLFFLSLFLLYKSKNNRKYLYLSLVSFFLAISTHIQALVLIPFFIFHILYYSKRKDKFFSLIPIIPLFTRLSGLFDSDSFSRSSSNGGPIGIFYLVNIQKYFNHLKDIWYYFVLFIPGMIWSYIKNKRLTLLIILPSLVTIVGIFTLKTFAFRYIYFFIFPLVLYCALLFSYLYEKYGKIILFIMFAFILISSNIFFPSSYSNMIVPVKEGFNFSSAPRIDYKNIPEDLITDIKSKSLVTYFSPDTEWYIKKPKYVLPFSLTGIGNDSVSYNNSKGEIVDKYSGARIINNLKDIEEKEFYFIASSFSVTKLKDNQEENIEIAMQECDLKYSKETLNIWFCEKEKLVN